MPIPEPTEAVSVVLRKVVQRKVEWREILLTLKYTQECTLSSRATPKTLEPKSLIIYRLERIGGNLTPPQPHGMHLLAVSTLQVNVRVNLK